MFRSHCDAGCRCRISAFCAIVLFCTRSFEWFCFVYFVSFMHEYSCILYALCRIFERCNKMQLKMPPFIFSQSQCTNVATNVRITLCALVIRAVIVSYSIEFFEFSSHSASYSFYTYFFLSPSYVLCSFCHSFGFFLLCSPSHHLHSTSKLALQNRSSIFEAVIFNNTWQHFKTEYGAL